MSLPCCYVLGDENNRIRALEEELAMLKAQMARLSLEQMEKSESKGNTCLHIHVCVQTKTIYRKFMPYTFNFKMCATYLN